jgi:hypothetical protein
MSGKFKAKQARKPIEGELTLKDLKSVVGGLFLVRTLTPHQRHKLLHQHPSFTNGLFA